MSLLICTCCKEKSINFLICCAKKYRCRECYQDVCRNCLSSSEMCHTCYVRERPDANTVEGLHELDSDELERLMKTLHLDPSKKSHNEWINDIARHCGLPMKSSASIANGHLPLGTDEDEIEDAKTDDHKLKNGKATPVKTFAITKVDDAKNKSSLHSIIMTEILSKGVSDIEDDEGIQADEFPKQNEPSDIQQEKISLPSTPMREEVDEVDESDDWTSEEVTNKSIKSNRKADIGFRHPDFNPNTTFTEKSVNVHRRTSKLTQSQTSVVEVKKEEETEDDESIELDVKIMKNIQQHRKLTVEEQQTLNDFEAKIQAWKNKTSQIDTEKRLSKNQIEESSQSTFRKTYGGIDETPITTNIRDIIAQMGGKSTGGGINRWSTVKPVTIENKQVIEIKNNKYAVENPTELKTTIQIDTPVSKAQEIKRLTFPETKPINRLPEVHQPTSSWNKTLNVLVNRRDSVQSVKQPEKTVEIIVKEPLQPKSSRRSSESVAKTENILSKQSVDYLLSTVENEKDIEQMDVLQMRKIIRQLNVKNGADLLFKRDDLVSELSRLWRMAEEQRQSSDKSKEIVIVVANQPVKTASLMPSSGTAVKVMSLSNITSEEQIRKLNIFQLKSLLQQEGEDVSRTPNSQMLVEKTIEKWHNLKQK